MVSRARRRTILGAVAAAAGVTAGLVGVATTRDQPDPAPSPSPSGPRVRMTGRDTPASKAITYVKHAHRGGVVSELQSGAVSGAAKGKNSDANGMFIYTSSQEPGDVEVLVSQVVFGARPGQSTLDLEILGAAGSRFVASLVPLDAKGSRVAFRQLVPDEKAVGPIDNTKPLRIVMMRERNTDSQFGYVALVDARNTVVLDSNMVMDGVPSTLQINAKGSDGVEADWSLLSVASGAADAGVLNNLRSQDTGLKQAALDEVMTAVVERDPTVRGTPRFASLDAGDRGHN